MTWRQHYSSTMMVGITLLLFGYTAIWGTLIKWVWLSEVWLPSTVAFQAVDEVERSGDRAAAFQLAQRLESDVSEL